MRTAHKTCNLCEAACGLVLEVDGNRVLSIKPDHEDPFSRGHICPKAFALKEIQEDPDRLRRPLRRTPRGSFEAISWDDALDEAAAGIARITARDGPEAVGLYYGNPVAHNLGAAFYLPLLKKAIPSRACFSSNSVDINPKLAASRFLFGSVSSIPIPDIDRTHFLLILGANPVVSNGSLMTAPGAGERIRAIRRRGGRVVVVDPRRTETARIADEHIFITPGRDALLLAALIHVVLDEGLARAGPATPLVSGTALLCERLRPFSPEAVEGALGIGAPAVRRIARAFAAASSAACYGRIGTCNHPYGTLASFLVDALNIVTGNLDRPGGAMFSKPAVDLGAGIERLGLAGGPGRWRSRVRGVPEFLGELPVACLAEEILTSGVGQVRGLVTLAGNPALSAPNGRAVERALASLEHMVAIDIYLNETTRHAHVILPPTWSLERDGYEAPSYVIAVRNAAKYSPPVLTPPPDARHDWQIMGELALRIVHGRGGLAWRAAMALLRRSLPSPRRLLDLSLRMGPYGPGLISRGRGLTLKKLEEHPSGIDLGPLEPALPRVLRTKSGRIELDHPVIAKEIERLRESLLCTADSGEARGATLSLIGRRDVRTDNSWAHNAPLLARGRPRCTLLMHPDDGARLGLADGRSVRVTSRVGSIVVPLALSDEIMPGVVSLPHGWGHDRAGAALSVAARNPGASANDLTDERMLEPIVGNAILNGVPVRVEAAG